MLAVIVTKVSLQLMPVTGASEKHSGGYHVEYQVHLKSRTETLSVACDNFPHLSVGTRGNLPGAKEPGQLYVGQFTGLSVHQRPANL